MLGTLMLAAALVPQEAAGTGTVRVGGAPAQAGERVRVASTVETRLAIVFTVAGAKLRDFEQIVRDVRSFEAGVATAAGGSVHVRADYGECRSVRVDPSGETTRALPVDSAHFLIARAPGAPADPARLTVQELDSARNEAGAVDAAVAAQVERDVGELLLGGRFAPLLAGKELAVGAPLDVPPAIAQAVLAGVLDGGTVKRFTLAPRAAGADGDAVAFDASLVVTMKEGDEMPVTSTFELAGAIELGRTHGRLVGLDLAGPIRFGGERDEGATRIEVSGTGTLTWKYRADPVARK